MEFKLPEPINISVPNAGTETVTDPMMERPDSLVAPFEGKGFGDAAGTETPILPNLPNQISSGTGKLRMSAELALTADLKSQQLRDSAPNRPALTESDIDSASSARPFPPQPPTTSTRDTTAPLPRDTTAPLRAAPDETEIVAPGPLPVEVEDTLEVETKTDISYDDVELEDLAKTDDFPIDAPPVDNGEDSINENSKELRDVDTPIDTPIDSPIDNGLIDGDESRLPSEPRLPQPANAAPVLTDIDAPLQELPAPETVAKDEIVKEMPRQSAPARPQPVLDASKFVMPKEAQELPRSPEPLTAAPINIPELIASSTKLFTIGVGQSLEQAAQELGIDVFDLLKANPQLLRDPLLFAGQRVKVPRGEEKVIEFQPPTQQPDLEPTRATLPRPAAVQSANTTATPVADSEKEPLVGNERNERKEARAEKESTRAVEGEKLKQGEGLMPGLQLVRNERDSEVEIMDESASRRRSQRQIPPPFDEWADLIYQAADKYQLEPALIASVIWCESGGKNITGKDGHGHGLMQIDDRRHHQWLAAHANGLEPVSNIDYGVALLRQSIDHFRGKLAAGIAAFNCGIDAVEEALVLGKPVDYFTAGGNYSISVLTQQEYFRRFF